MEATFNLSDGKADGGVLEYWHWRRRSPAPVTLRILCFDAAFPGSTTTSRLKTLQKLGSAFLAAAFSTRLGPIRDAFATRLLWVMQVDIFNIGSEDQIGVKTIANTVVEEMGLKDVRLRFTGGVDGGRGWIGDVKSMSLQTSRLKSEGWTPRYDSE